MDRQKHDWRKVDFGDNNLDGCFHCKNCRWPVSVYNPPYQSADHGKLFYFHIVGKFGEQTNCQKAVMTNKPFDQGNEGPGMEGRAYMAVFELEGDPR